jgi:hypothetical protein
VGGVVLHQVCSRLGVVVADGVSVWDERRCYRGDGTARAVEAFVA